jgi:hypothetical protein
MLDILVHQGHHGTPGTFITISCADRGHVADGAAVTSGVSALAWTPDGRRAT